MENYNLQAVQFRIARPTNQLSKLVSFYTKAIGLTVIGAFTNHDGYDGVMLGLPGSGYHLEFTQHIDLQPCPAPTRDNLLVLYFDNTQFYQQAADRAVSAGAAAVEPENPYWKGQSLTVEDPDGWRVVFFNGIYKPGFSI